jgi:hypothetical protein
MEDDDILNLQVTVLLQSMQIDALRRALGPQAAAELEQQLVERISQIPISPTLDEAATAWAAAVLRCCDNA